MKNLKIVNGFCQWIGAAINNYQCLGKILEKNDLGQRKYYCLLKMEIFFDKDTYKAVAIIRKTAQLSKL